MFRELHSFSEIRGVLLFLKLIWDQSEECMHVQIQIMGWLLGPSTYMAVVF